MILKDFLPDASLREFVQCYRIVHFESDKMDELFFKAYPPKPEVCLHFILNGTLRIASAGGNKKELQLSMHLLGQQTAVISQYSSNNLLDFQVVFQPTAVYRLTGIPANELTNKCLKAEDIFPKNIRFAFEALQQVKTYLEMLPVADRFVRHLINHAQKEGNRLDAVCDLLMKRAGNISVDRLAKESCYSIKQFTRRFYERTGINSKTYERIIKFQQAYYTKNANPGWDWLKIAVSCNYYDYQHLAKDYMTFTGLTPCRFHLQEFNSPEWKLGLAKELYRDRFRLTCPAF